MNVQPPVQNRFIAFPGMTQRDTVTNTSARKPSLAVGGKPSPLRGHLVAFIGEFLGTFMFLFFAFAAANIAIEECESCKNVANTSGGPAPSGPTVGQLLYIALAFGFSLAVNAWIFFRISGGLFNPAVTFGLMLIGCLTWFRALIVFIAQILGAIAAAAVVKGLFPFKLQVVNNLSSETSRVRGFFIEMFLTALLVFTIFMLAAEKHRATFIAPIGIGLALFVGHLAGARFTGAGINPARSFGPSVVNGSFPHHWIYWIAPLAGALLAVVVYRIIKALEYETYGAADQDADHIALAKNSFGSDSSGSAPIQMAQSTPMAQSGPTTQVVQQPQPAQTTTQTVVAPRQTV